MTNKRYYSQPMMKVDMAQHTQMLCSSITSIKSDDVSYGGGGTGPSRAPECDDWDVWGDN